MSRVGEGYRCLLVVFVAVGVKQQTSACSEVKRQQTTALMLMMVMLLMMVNDSQRNADGIVHHDVP